MRALVVAALGLGACTHGYYTSDVNAPGNVTLAPPARENGAPELYVEPTDPGEHELYFAPGLTAGPVLGRHPDGNDAGVELGFYVHLAYKTSERSHRKDDLPYPVHGWSLNLGWSPLQTGADVDIGPTWVEVERNWYFLSAALGAAVYPDDGDAGVQLTLAARPYGLRLRYMNETGFELVGAFQVELPRAYAWSR
jgi:hypothetical protein